MMFQTIHFNMVAVFIMFMLFSFASGQNTDTTDSSTTMSSDMSDSSSNETTTTSTSTTSSTTTTNGTVTAGSAKQQSIIMPITIIGSLFISLFIGYIG